MQGLSNKERDALGSGFADCIGAGTLALPVWVVTLVVFMRLEDFAWVLPLVAIGTVAAIVTKALVGRVKRVKWTGDDYVD